MNWCIVGDMVSFYFSNHWKHSADIFAMFCFYYWWSKKSANEAAHSWVLWYLASAELVTCHSKNTILSKRVWLGWSVLRSLFCSWWRAWISLEAKWRPYDPVLTGSLAQILKSACILDNSPMQKKGFKPSSWNMHIYLLLLPNFLIPKFFSIWSLR